MKGETKNQLLIRIKEKRKRERENEAEILKALCLNNRSLDLKQF